MKNIFNLAIGAFIALTLVSSCEKKETTQPSKPKPYDSGQVQLMVISKFNSKVLNQFNPTSDTTWNNRKITINNAQIYLSQFEFVDLYQGADTRLPVAFILNTLNSSSHDLGKVPAKEYASTKMYLGLPGYINDKPSSYSSYLNDPSMWFDTVNNSMKYVFIRITGLVDTSANKNGNIDAPFDIKIGGSSFFQPITLPFNIPLVGQGDFNLLRINVDFAKIIDGLDLADPDIRQMVTPARAIRYSNILIPNIKSAFD